MAVRSILRMPIVLLAVVCCGCDSFSIDNLKQNSNSADFVKESTDPIKHRDGEPQIPTSVTSVETPDIQTSDPVINPSSISSDSIVPSSSDQTSASEPEQDKQMIKLTILQHPLLSHAEDGYYFENKILATTTVEYEKGYYLTQDDISNELKSPKVLNYTVPSSVYKPDADGHVRGYYFISFFVTEFDEETGHGYGWLKPRELLDDMTLHFCVYG